MRLPRFRVTVRRLMLAVAVVALLLAAVLVLDGRRRRFAQPANDHGLKAIGEIKAKRPGGRHKELYEKYINAAHHQ